MPYVKQLFCIGSYSLIPVCIIVTSLELTVILGQPYVCTKKLSSDYFEGRKFSRRVVEVIPHPKYEVRHVPGKVPQLIYDFALLKVM